ncbi:MAG: aminotransferase class V-fold PLP-dependent enzyme [Flavobacteriales bacterium]
MICEGDHHSNIVPWQLLARDCGAVLRILPITDSGEWDLSVIDQLISSRTKLVASCSTRAELFLTSMYGNV